MKKTLQIINELVEVGIIREYALAGGMAQFYYIEPSVTYDLDLIVNLVHDGNNLDPLAALYEWANENNHKCEDEHIIIAGIPVQFLLPYNKLVTEALENRVQISLFEEKAFILTAEYLMGIMLQTWRPIDRERLIRFMNEVKYDKNILNDIIKRFDLANKYKNFKDRYDG